MSKNLQVWVKAIGIALAGAWLGLSADVAEGTISEDCDSHTYSINMNYNTNWELLTITIWDRAKHEIIVRISQRDLHGTIDPLDLRYPGDDQGQHAFRIWWKKGVGRIIQFEGNNEEVATCESGFL